MGEEGRKEKMVCMSLASACLSFSGKELVDAKEKLTEKECHELCAT